MTAPRMMSIDAMRVLRAGVEGGDGREARSGEAYGPTGVRVPVGETTVLILVLNDDGGEDRWTAVR
jgi:hypothetical protein